MAAKFDDNSDKDSVKTIYKDKLSEQEFQLYLNLPEQTLQEYSEVFEMFDQTGDGTISNEEIGQVMQGLGENPTQEKIDELILEIDYDNDGEVDFDEFVVLMVKTLYEAEMAEEELVEVFKSFDKDGNGAILPHEIQASLMELGYVCDEDEAKEMVSFFDLD